MTALYLKAFANSVRSEVAPILDECCIALQQETDWLFHAISPRLRMTIFLGRFGNYVQILLGPNNLESARSGEEFELQWVLTALAPETRERDRWPKLLLSGGLVEKEIRAELHGKMEIIRRLMPNLLRGEATLWQEVERTARSEGGLSKQKDESMKEYVTRLRSEAKYAWRSGQYWSVRSRYDMIYHLSGTLTFVERWRLWWAQRFTFDIEWFT